MLHITSSFEEPHILNQTQEDEMNCQHVVKILVGNLRKKKV